MGKGAVWISEDLEGGYLLGTFSGVHDTGGARPRDAFSDLPIEEALAWARARADHVCVEIVYARYSAGARPLDDYPAWPPHDLPALVRRRPPGEEWRDRTDDDDPIAWAVVAWVARADSSMPVRADWDAAVAALAARAGADGWDTEELDGRSRRWSEPCAGPSLARRSAGSPTGTPRTCSGSPSRLRPGAGARGGPAPMRPAGRPHAHVRS